MIFKNVSGDPVTVSSANIIALAPAATIDLGTVVDGLPLLTQARIESDYDLRAAVTSGDLVTVVDGVEQTTADSLLAVTPSSQLDIERRAYLLASGSVPLLPGVEVTLYSWPIAVGHRRSVVINVLDMDTPNAGRPSGGVYSAILKAGRLGAAGAQVLGSSVTRADNLPGDRLRFHPVGNDVELRFRASILGTLEWSMQYTTTERTAP